MKKIIILMISIVFSVINIFAINATNEIYYSNDNIEFMNLTNISDINLDINPYKYNKLNEIIIKEKIMRFKEPIDFQTKIRLKDMSEENKDYIVMQFNKNPSTPEIKQLQDEGIYVCRVSTFRDVLHKKIQ